MTPLSALRLAELAADIFPTGVLNVITGPGGVVGSGSITHPDVDMVSLTGDTATGKEIAAAAAQTVKRVHLELGGKAPVLVFDDADLDALAEAIKLAGFFNCGQDCTAATRIIVGSTATTTRCSSARAGGRVDQGWRPARSRARHGAARQQDQQRRVSPALSTVPAATAGTIATGGDGERRPRLLLQPDRS